MNSPFYESDFRILYPHFRACYTEADIFKRFVYILNGGIKTVAELRNMPFCDLQRHYFGGNARVEWISNCFNVLRDIEQKFIAVLDWENSEKGVWGLDGELETAMRGAGLGDGEKLVLVVRGEKVVIFLHSSENCDSKVAYYSKSSTDLDWTANDPRFKELQKLVAGDFNVMYNVGKAKYVINIYDGQTHKDGSRFYDIHIFKNKKFFEKRIKELKALGYAEK